MNKSKSNRGVPDGTGPEGKGPTGGRRPPQKPKREDFDSDEAFDEAMDRWNMGKSCMLSAIELLKAARVGSGAPRRWKDGKLHKKVGGKWVVVSEGTGSKTTVQETKREGQSAATGKMHSRYMYTGKDFMAKPKKVLINNDGWVVSINGKKIDPVPLEDYGDYFLSEKPVSNVLDRWGDRTDGLVKKSQEDFMEATGLALVIIPGELTKAAKLSGVGSGHPAKLSGPGGKIKSQIAYTGHQERMKLAKIAMERMRSVVSSPEDEGEYSEVGFVDRKVNESGKKPAYTGYSTGVSGMESQAHDLFGKQTVVVKPSQLGSSAPEGTTKHTPVKRVRKPRR